jgi:hypothetical protein
LRVQIVNKTKESADLTLAALHEAGLPEANYVPYSNGFSWYLGENEGLDAFLALGD